VEDFTLDLSPPPVLNLLQNALSTIRLRKITDNIEEKNLYLPDALGELLVEDIFYWTYMNGETFGKGRIMGATEHQLVFGSKDLIDFKPHPNPAFSAKRITGTRVREMLEEGKSVYLRVKDGVSTVVKFNSLNN
jgi:hypothetical protein